MLENSAGRVVLRMSEPKLAHLMVVGGVKTGRNRGRGTAVAFVWMLRARIVSEYPALQKATAASGPLALQISKDYVSKTDIFTGRGGPGVV